ncbi:MAG: aldose 1-epimerase family protein [Bifidobacteriaceae bacterium]|jgi:aldose 1-epimerase|nr:aldose 1-epimerase family protein [Bifidobacteriaceae bacterium]
MSLAQPLSGAQHVIAAGPYRAEIASVGATLRRLAYQGRDLVVPFEAGQVRPHYRGAVLAPWPNRVIDGRYTARGARLQLPLSEPDRLHALHGLALWVGFGARTASGGGVVLEGVVEPQAGYPHRLALEVSYMADAVQGLTWSVAATNLGTQAAPYGCGPHPYLVAGPGVLDSWALTLPAESFIEVEGPRLLPGAVRAVDGLAFDFRAGAVLGATRIDHCFGGIGFGADGRAVARLEDPSGTGVSISWDAACPWVQVHTADLPAPGPSRLGLAVEPMTCPPDAFNSGRDLVWLAPGETHRASWTIAAW